MNKLVAVKSHSYPSGKSIVTAYVLDGSPEQHEAYRARVASSSDPKRAAVSEHEFEDRENKMPELKGNPMFYSLEDEGDCVEITIPTNPEQMPRIETLTRDKDIALTKKLGGDTKECLGVWNAYVATNMKARFSKQTKAAVETDIDDLDQQDKN